MFFVRRDDRVRCVCIDSTSKQPFPGCPKCLGTGRKIEIRKVRAARQNSKVSFRGAGVSETASGSVYYLKVDAAPREGDLFVDGSDVDVVQRCDVKRSDDRLPIYFRCETVPQKSNKTLFLQNFREIVGEKNWTQPI